MPIDFDSVEWVAGTERDPGSRPIVSHQNGRLHSVVVNYTGKPDRRTVFPADTTSYDRTTAWFTADAAAFVDLGDAR